MSSAPFASSKKGIVGIDMTYEGIEYAGRVASSSAREQLRAGLGERCHGDDRERHVVVLLR